MVTVLVIGTSILGCGVVACFDAGFAKPAIGSSVICVFRRIWVTLGAMRLTRVLRRVCFAAHEVFADSDGLKVGRINACVIPAQVVKLETWRHGTAREFVCESVGWDLTATPEIAVAFRTFPAYPLPAVRPYLYPLKEPRRGINSNETTCGLVYGHMWSIAQYG
jgi:hypothetical protein